MLARIRLHKDGLGSSLSRSVDLLRFSESDIRERLVETGYDYDEELLVVGFEDWECDIVMTLSEAYMLKVVLEQYYDGDEFIICHMIKSHRPVKDLIYSHYRFLSKDELEAMQHILKNSDQESLVAYFFKVNNWVNLIQSYVSAGILLNTSRGFYELHE